MVCFHIWDSFICSLSVQESEVYIFNISQPESYNLEHMNTHFYHLKKNVTILIVNYYMRIK